MIDREMIDKDKTVHVAFVGNPNCGKTTLFNAITGSKLKVANWPGVTVEKIEGEAEYEGFHLTLVDTPGIYSLTCYTIEEKVTRQCVMDDDIEVIVNIVDASSLERNLYLTMQLLELGKPMVLALNMMDIVEERGTEIDLHRLPELLGDIPVVPVSAARRTGLDILLHAVVHHYEEGSKGNVLYYGDEIEHKLAKLEVMMQAHYPTHSSVRWHAIKLLEEDEEVWEEHPISVTNVVDRSYEKEIIQAKYAYIENIVNETLFYKQKKKERTDKIDALLTHPVWGVPMFLLIMGFVFFLTFVVGDFLKGFFEIGLDKLSNGTTHLLTTIHVAGWMQSLVVDGIIAGVGGILTFIPNIFILFLALAFLEDSGYMARVAYVMNEIMGRVGLSGKAFLPMLLGFGCTVPAVMASRALPSERDRRRTILITPFMSCSARLPIYVLFAQMFFPDHALWIAYSLYLIGLATAILIAFVVHKLDQTGEEDALLIELPEYKTPNVRTVWIYVWDKVKDYLSKAGTTIFLASIVLWFVLNFGISGYVSEVTESFAAGFGRILAPALKPAGLGSWQVAVALISGLSAKEVVVSSFSVLYGVSNINSGAGMSQLSASLAATGFGGANAYALMVFCLMYTPCVAAIGAIRRETHSWKFTLGLIGFQILIAWSASVLVFQVLSAFLNVFE